MRRAAMIPWLWMLMVAAAVSEAPAQEPLPPIAHRGIKLIRPVQKIPVQQFGYKPPGSLPALQGYQLVEMLYVDGRHLLFSFNIPALMEHDVACTSQNGNLEHRERAVVVDLQSNTRAMQTEWSLGDYGQFVWPLQNGKFLLRRCANLSKVDANFEEEPIAGAHGAPILLEMSPGGTRLLLEWKEDLHLQERAKVAAGQITNGTPSASVDPRRILADFLKMDPLAIMAKSRLDVPAYLPVLRDGFLEMEGLPHDRWRIDFQPYQGKLQVVTTFRSGCQPGVYSLTDTTFFVDTCNEYFSAKSRQAYDLKGHLLWHDTVDLRSVHPQVAIAQDESVFAIATAKTINYAAPSMLNNLDAEAGQDINVYSAQMGKKLLSVTTTPIYTAGGNFALSPKGDHLAVLQNGAIEIYPIQK